MSKKSFSHHSSDVPADAHQKSPTRSNWAVSPTTLLQFLIFNFAFLIFVGCGFDVEDPTPPEPPQWVPKSLPEEWPERGIDAHEAGGIHLAWYGNLEEEIEKYHIYRVAHQIDGENSDDLEKIGEVDNKHLEYYAYVDVKINTNIRYSYRLKAEDSSNNLSEYSNSLDYPLLPQIVEATLSPNSIYDSLSTDRTLSWEYIYLTEMQDYCITIIDNHNKLVLRTVFNPADYSGRLEFWKIPDSISLKKGELYKWRIDTAARYRGGFETSGSESIWATFIY